MKLTSSFLAVLAAAAAVPTSASAQAQERTGKQVVESVCASCHLKGLKGAPRIGDHKAWSQRAAQGLTSLTDHALKGIREMPAHGGAPNLTDLEIARAVTYMVNQSGGTWVEPASAKDLMAERGGEQVVKEQCAKCHQDGKDGAPKVGDRNAWKPRLTQGLDNLVRSAIRGHGGMPPRGGEADLTDAELRNAILYMYNPSAPPRTAAKAPPAEPPTGVHRTVGGMDVLLGLVSAADLRKFPQGSVERKMHGGVPAGRDFYHLNVSLLDHTARTRITDAAVEVQVEQPGGISSETKKLESVVVNNAASYGAYVRLKPNTHYVITVRVRKPGDPRPVEARFDHRQN